MHRSFLAVVCGLTSVVMIPSCGGDDDVDATRYEGEAESEGENRWEEPYLDLTITLGDNTSLEYHFSNTPEDCEPDPFCGVTGRDCYRCVVISVSDTKDWGGYSVSGIDGGNHSALCGSMDELTARFATSALFRDIGTYPLRQWCFSDHPVIYPDIGGWYLGWTDQSETADPPLGELTVSEVINDATNPEGHTKELHRVSGHGQGGCVFDRNSSRANPVCAGKTNISFTFAGISEIYNIWGGN